MTMECNYTCRYCPIISATRSKVYEQAQILRQQGELTTEQAKYAIDWLKRIGVVGLSFTGGEPLLRDDLEEIAAYAKKRNFFNVLNTNASLVTENRAYNLAKCFDCVTVSLWGNPEVDNMLRGSQTYERTTSGIQILKETTSLKININFVINRENYREIDCIVDYAKKNCHSITFLPVSYKPVHFLDWDSANFVQQKLLTLKKQYGHFISNNVEDIKLFCAFLTGDTPHFKCDPYEIYLGLGPNGTISGCCAYLKFEDNIFSVLPADYRALAKKNKRNILDQCGGCSSPLCRELSALYRRPFFSNVFIFKKYLDLLNNK
jgi:MoaA/NifB/PqqE/SkfB family radical SAM enzyme